MTIPRGQGRIKKCHKQIINNLIYKMMQSFYTNIANIHCRPLPHCLKTLSREFENGKLDSPFHLGFEEQVATISVVGVPDWNGNGIVSRAFAALGKHGTRVIAVAQAASEYSVSFCIPEDQVIDTVRFLHRELGLEK